MDPRMQALMMFEKDTAGEQMASGLGQRFPGLPAGIPAAAGFAVDAFNPMRKFRQLTTGNPREQVPMSSLQGLRQTLGGGSRDAMDEAILALMEQEGLNAPR